MSAQQLVYNIIHRSDEDIRQAIPEEYTVFCYISKFGDITKDPTTESAVVILKKGNVMYGSLNQTNGLIANISKIPHREHKHVFIN